MPFALSYTTAKSEKNTPRHKHTHRERERYKKRKNKVGGMKMNLYSVDTHRKQRENFGIGFQISIILRLRVAKISRELNTDDVNQKSPWSNGKQNGKTKSENNRKGIKEK